MPRDLRLLVFALAAACSSEPMSPRAPRSSQRPLIEATPFDVTPDSGVFEFSPSVASDGTDFFVAWTSSLGQVYGAFGRRVLADGGLPDPTPIQLEKPGRFVGVEYPAVAGSAAGYFVAWCSEVTSSLNGLTVLPDGTVSSIQTVSPTVANCPVGIAYDGSRYIVVWSSVVGGGPLSIQGCEVATSGTVGTALTLETSATGPRLDCAGSSCAMTWLTLDGGARVASLDTSGGWPPKMGPASLIASSGGSAPGVLVLGDHAAVAWSGLDGGAYDEHVASFQLADGGLFPAGGTVIASNVAATPAALAHSGSNLLVLWEQSDLRGMEVEVSSSSLMPIGLPVLFAVGTGDPAVGSNASQSLLAYSWSPPVDGGSRNIWAQLGAGVDGGFNADGGQAGDAGLAVDGGPAGDAGLAADGGSLGDGGALADGGPSSAAVPSYGVDCGCGSSGSGAPWWAALALALAVRRLPHCREGHRRRRSSVGKAQIVSFSDGRTGRGQR